MSEATLTPPTQDVKIPIRFYREVEGEKRPFILYIDANRNFIEEVFDEDHYAMLQRAAHAKLRIEEQRGDQEQLKASVEAAMRHHAAPGTVLDPEIQKKIKEGKTWLWFSKDYPNSIDGSEELRQEFFKELEELHATHAAKGTKCKGCEEGALSRKYRKILKERNLIP